jgi:hypothetical protein
MFEYINSIFAWGTVPDQKFILVSDSFTADASFLLQHFIGMFAKNKQHLCIVGAENSFFHYFSVARKLVRFFFFFFLEKKKLSQLSLS